MKAFLRKDYENLITVDFVCHSVPSPMAWREYVKYRAVQDNNGKMPDTINLRSKQSGWTNYQYSNLFTYADRHTHVTRSGGDPTRAFTPFHSYRIVQNMLPWNATQYAQ